MTELPPTNSMLAFILRFIQSPDQGGMIEVPSESHQDFIVLFGMVQRVRRLAMAFLRLRKSGFASEGKVLLRAALEHAVTAQWVYLTPGGVARANVTLATAQAQLTEDMVRYSSNPEWPTLAAQLRDSVPDGPGLPKFTGGDGVMGELDDIYFLRMTYRILSQVGHVTHQSALDFLVEEDGRLQLRAAPEQDSDGELLYALAGFCMLAAWVLARLEDDQMEIQRLRELSVALHVPWRLDTHLPKHRRRFPDEVP